MIKNKTLRMAIIAIFACVCVFGFISCGKTAKDTMSDMTQQVCEDSISERVSFGKKYYSLGYSNYTKNEYYTFNENGTATYTHIMQDDNKTTFHQEIRFKWTYVGDGDCILIHNGTKMIKGEQDEAFGISRVMRVGKDIVYWSDSGSNAYFISEDFLSQIPNYAKLITK